MPHNTHSIRTTAIIVYALQGIALATALPMFIAVIINYIKLDDAKGTWVESHFRWQIRTFWFSLLWTVVGSLLTVIFIGWLILGINFLWVLYRVIKGAIQLSDDLPV